MHGCTMGMIPVRRIGHFQPEDEPQATRQRAGHFDVTLHPQGERLEAQVDQI